MSIHVVFNVQFPIPITANMLFIQLGYVAKYIDFFSFI